VCPESLRGFRSETYSFLGFQKAISATVDVAKEMEGYQGAVTRYIHYLVRNTAEAEDFVQETFLRAQRQQACRFARQAQISSVDISTIHRWLKSTDNTSRQIHITDELRARFVDEAPLGYLPVLETTMKLGVSRQAVSQRVKRGELQALYQPEL
jgi:hypothetical protein